MSNEFRLKKKIYNAVLKSFIDVKLMNYNIFVYFLSEITDK